MKYLFNYDKINKQITISAATDCTWACSVVNGNIRLNKYYGSLITNEPYSATVYSYGINEMYGGIECRFDDGECQMVKSILIDATDLFLFNITNTKVFLFGKDTKTYLYLYYGYISDAVSTSISNIINVNLGGSFNTTLEYRGEEINEAKEDEYQFYMSNYNSINGYVEIIITSLNDKSFHDTIWFTCTIDGKIRKIVVNIYQDVSPYKPTLFKISPSVVFLTSQSLKQKIAVTCIQDGITLPYSWSIINPQTNVIQTNVNAVEEYLNGNFSQSFSMEDNLFNPTIVKKATHFTIEIDNVENLENLDEQVGHILYVFPEHEPSQTKQVEVFFDYIQDPNNYIKIIEIKNVYGKYYQDGENFVFSTDISINEDINTFNLHFTKNIISGTNEVTKECFVALGNQIIECTVDSKPSYYNIVQESPNLREVIQGNKLAISLEKHIDKPSENGKIVLKNKNGATYYIYISNEEDIFDVPKAQFGFYSNNTLNDIYEVTVPDIIQTFIPIQIISLSDKEEITLIDTVKTFDNVKNLQSVNCDVIYYSYDNKKEIRNFTFNVKFNQNIGKYYISYGSLHDKFVSVSEQNDITTSVQQELHDTNDYYFEQIDDNIWKIVLPQPYSDLELPWGVKNNGNGIKFKVYRYEEDSTWSELNELNIISSGGTISAISTELDNQPRHILIGFMQKPQNNFTIDDKVLRVGDICFIAQQRLDNTIKESIVLQQALTYNQITLYAIINGTNVSNSIFRIGTTSLLENMRKVNSYENASTLTTVNVEVPHNMRQSLFYASYQYENVFKHILLDVDIKLRMFYDIYLKELETWDNYNAVMKYNIYSDNESYKTDLEKIDTILQSQGTYTGGTTSPSWEIDFKNGYINFIYILSNNIDEQIRRAIPVQMKEYKKPNIRLFDMGKIENNFFILYVERNDNVLQNYEMDALENNEIYHTIMLDGTIQNYANFVHKYPIVENYLTINGNEYSSFNNKFFYDGQYYDIYEENGKNYITLNNVTNPIRWDDTINSFVFNLLAQNQESIRLVSQYDSSKSGLTYTHTNLIMYEPNIYWEVENECEINILESIDGQDDNRQEQDKYIVLGNAKYNTDINNEKIIVDNLISYQINNSSACTLTKSTIIPSIVNASYQYIILDHEKYKLIENFVIYDNIKYNLLKNEENLYIINNKGYSAYTQNDEIYTIINNQRCDVVLTNYPYTNYLYYEDFIRDEKGNVKYFQVTNVFKETLRYDVQLKNLINNELIKSYYNGEDIISNGYGEIKEQKFIILKEHNLEDITYEIKTKEYIQIPFSSLTTNNKNEYAFSAFIFNDDSDIEIFNGETKDYQSYKKDDTLTISSSSTITFFDYSEITFEEDTWVTYLTDNKNIYANYTKFYNSGELAKIEPQTSIKINMGNNIKLYVTNRIVGISMEIEYNTQTIGDLDGFVIQEKSYLGANANVSDEILYLGEQMAFFKILLINNQEAIKYKGNIYYIYNNQVIINNNTYYCYDRCCIYNNGMEDCVIPIHNFSSNNVSAETFNNINYGFIKNNEIKTVNVKDSIIYKITLPTYKSNSNDNGKIILHDYNITDILVYNTKFYDYTRAIVENYFNDINESVRDTQNLIIENDKLEVIIDKYEVIIDDDRCYTTSSIDNYEFMYNGIKQSVWNWLDNKMLSAIPIAVSASTQSIYMKGEITIDDYHMACISDGYVKIDNEFYPILYSNIQTYGVHTTEQSVYTMNCFDICTQKTAIKDFNVLYDNSTKYLFVISYASPTTRFDIEKDVEVIGKINEEQFFFYYDGQKYVSSGNTIRVGTFKITISSYETNCSYIDYHPFICTSDNGLNVKTIDYLNLNNTIVSYYFYNQDFTIALFPLINYLNTSGLSTTEVNAFQNQQDGEVEYYIHNSDYVKQYIFEKTLLKVEEDESNIIISIYDEYNYEYEQIKNDVKIDDNYLLFTSLLSATTSSLTYISENTVNSGDTYLLKEQGLHKKDTDNLIRFISFNNGEDCEWAYDAVDLDFNIRLGNVMFISGTTSEVKEYYDLLLSQQNRKTIKFNFKQPTLFYIVKPYFEKENYVHFYLCTPIFHKKVQLLYENEIWDNGINDKYHVRSYETMTDKIPLIIGKSWHYSFPTYKIRKNEENYIIYKDNFNDIKNNYHIYPINNQLNMVTIYDKKVEVMLNNDKTQCYVDIDSNAALTFDVNFIHNPFTQGEVKSCTIENLSELEQTINVILTQQTEDDNKLQGQFDVKLK